MALAWKAGWVNSPRGFESRILRDERSIRMEARSRLRPTLRLAWPPLLGRWRALPVRRPQSFILGVAVRVVRLPAPRVGAHVLDRPGRGPAQVGLGPRGVGVGLGDVTAAAWGDLVREVVSARA